MGQLNTSSSLHGLNILVTRPEHQAQDLCELITSQGGKAIRFPVLEITAPSDLSSIESCMDKLAQYELGIFVSINAVNALFQHLESRNKTLPEQIKLAVIGKGTQYELDNRGISIDICPDNNFNSEALLAMDSMQQVKGKHVVIFKGEGGRNLLETTLINRGALVDTMELYRRIPATTDPAPLLQLWQEHQLHVVTTTSNEGLQALFDIVGSTGREYLCNTPMVVISERMLKKTRELGIRAEIIVADEVSNEGIVRALEDLVCRLG